MSDNLSELWREASMYGRVYLHTSDDCTMFCKIAFNTIAHVELTAKSDFGHSTPEKAVIEAIKKAREIVASLDKEMPKLKQIGSK